MMNKVLVSIPLLLSLGYALTDDMRLELLIAHNKYRGYVNNPYAASMPAVAWDYYLERESQKYADKCYWGHSTSTERQYFDGRYVGENLYASSWSPSGENVVSSWYSEVKDYTYPTGSSTGAVVGHYTQVVWANSIRIGCGVAKCSSIEGISWSGTIVVCRYLPGGNSGGAPYVSSDENCNTCAAMGYQCGTYTDNCSKTVTCNSCNSSESCINNVCVLNNCKPKTSCNKDYECGTIHDGCGWYVKCGECPVGKICNPNNHKCGDCTAKTSCNSDYECGKMDDGCGAFVKCGDCEDGFKCNQTSHKCVKKSSNSVAIGLGVTFGLIGAIAIVVVVLVILVKKGILTVDFEGDNEPVRTRKADKKAEVDMEGSAGYAEKASAPPPEKHKAPSSAPPRAPQAQPPHAPYHAKRPPPQSPMGGGGAPPLPPRR